LPPPDEPPPERTSNPAAAAQIRGEPTYKRAHEDKRVTSLVPPTIKAKQHGARDDGNRQNQQAHQGGDSRSQGEDDEFSKFLQEVGSLGAFAEN